MSTDIKHTSPTGGYTAVRWPHVRQAFSFQRFDSILAVVMVAFGGLIIAYESFLIGTILVVFGVFGAVSIAAKFTDPEETIGTQLQTVLDYHEATGRRDFVDCRRFRDGTFGRLIIRPHGVDQQVELQSLAAQLASFRWTTQAEDLHETIEVPELDAKVSIVVEDLDETDGEADANADVTEADA